MELRKKDAGESECSPVMGEIGIASLWNSRGQDHPLRKQAEFQLVSYHEKICQKAKGGQLLTASNC
jgi:hypothetical protein